MYQKGSKDMKKEILMIGIIILFLSTTCLPVLASEALPDLIIEDMVIGPTHNPFDEGFNCQVKNIGDVSTSPDKDLDISVSVRWKIFGLFPLIKIRQFDAGPIGLSLAPGETDLLPFATTSSMPLFGYYAFYCTVNPHLIIEESNYQNNRYTETVFFLLRKSFP